MDVVWLPPCSAELASDLDDSESLVVGNVADWTELSPWARIPALRSEVVDNLPGSSKLMCDVLRLELAVGDALET